MNADGLRPTKVIAMFLLVNSFLMANASGILSAAKEVIDTVPPSLNTVEIMLHEGRYATEHFSSHLPLIVFDTPIANNDARDAPLSVAMRTIDWEDMSGNSLDSPSIAFNAELLRVAPPDQTILPKSDYYIHIKTQDNSLQHFSLAGMSPGGEWLLLGSMRDKSLLRNYLAYIVAGLLGAEIPEMKFCEVFIREEDRYNYQGVYLLVRDTRQIVRYYTVDALDTPDMNQLVLLRSPLNNQPLILDTQASREKSPSGYLSLPYPADAIVPALLNQVTTRINALESALYSDNPVEFSTYTNYVDVDSFVTYVIVNGLFGNVDAGYRALYTYDTLSQKVTAVPFISFDTTLDNDVSVPLEVTKTYLDTAPWLDRIMKSKPFLDSLTVRYRTAWRTELPDKLIDQLIDEAVAHLGPAQARDWTRWHEDYKSADLTLEPSQDFADSGELSHYTRIREMDTYDEEIIKIKYMLHTRGQYLITALSELQDKRDTIAPADNYVRNSLSFIGYLCLFILSIRIVRVRTR